MSVTLKDVSQHAGVSLSTVGMILGGHDKNYSAKMREKVIQAAAALNYRPHVSARGLRVKRSFLIGVSLFRSNAPLMADLLRGVQRGLAPVEYSALMFSHSSREEELECCRRCGERHVDGMIINPGLSIDGTADTKMSYLDAIGRNIPVVELFGRAVVEAPGVNIDYFAAGRVAAEHLLALGHRRIAMLTHDRYDAASATGSGRHADAWRRSEGYRQALADAGLQPCVLTHPIRGEFEVAKDFYNGGFGALGQILNHPARPSALVCYNDLQVYGLLRAAESQNVNIPGQLSVVGYGDLEFSDMVNPPITTFAVPAFEVGQRAAECLLGLIEKQTFDDVLLESKLIVRGSTSAAGGVPS